MQYLTFFTKNIFTSTGIRIGVDILLFTDGLTKNRVYKCYHLLWVALRNMCVDIRLLALKLYINGLFSVPLFFFSETENPIKKEAMMV